MLSHFLPQLDLFLDLVGLRVLHSKPATPKAIFILVLFSSFLLLHFVVCLLLGFLPFLSCFPSFCTLFVVLLYPLFLLLLSYKIILHNRNCRELQQSSRYPDFDNPIRVRKISKGICKIHLSIICSIFYPYV